MKKYVAICATLAAALAWVGVASAAAPQGKLTGSSVSAQLTITTPILDGGTNFVGLENDNSGRCRNDSGAVTYGGVAETIICAHFVASSRDGSGPKMRFAFPNPFNPGCYSVVRISDGGATDKVGEFLTCGSGIDIPAIVNKGAKGGTGITDLWGFTTVDGYTVTASQT